MAKAIQRPLTVKMDPRVKDFCGCSGTTISIEMKLASMLTSSSEAAYGGAFRARPVEKVVYTNEGTNSSGDSQFTKKIEKILEDEEKSPRTAEPEIRLPM